jgi:hypothetical protein
VLSGIRVDFSAQRLGSRSLDSFFLYQRPVVGIAWSSACSLLLVATKIFCVLLVSRAPVLDSPELWSHFLCSRISFLQIQLVFSLEVLPVSIFATQSAGAWGQGFSNPVRGRNFSVLRFPVRTGQSKVPLGFLCKSSFACCSQSASVVLAREQCASIWCGSSYAVAFLVWCRWPPLGHILELSGQMIEFF